jgi:hypothetical protein
VTCVFVWFSLLDIKSALVSHIPRKPGGARGLTTSALAALPSLQMPRIKSIPHGVTSDGQEVVHSPGETGNPF